MVLDSPHTPEVKEQALCIIGNIAGGAGVTDYVMEDERILRKLLDYMVNLVLKYILNTSISLTKLPILYCRATKMLNCKKVLCLPLKI